MTKGESSISEARFQCGIYSVLLSHNYTKLPVPLGKEVVPLRRSFGLR